MSDPENEVEFRPKTKFDMEDLDYNALLEDMRKSRPKSGGRKPSHTFLKQYGSIDVDTRNNDENETSEQEEIKVKPYTRRALSDFSLESKADPLIMQSPLSPKNAFFEDKNNNTEPSRDSEPGKAENRYLFRQSSTALQDYPFLNSNDNKTETEPTKSEEQQLFGRKAFSALNTENKDNPLVRLSSNFLAKQEEDRQFPAFSTENKDKPLVRLSNNFLTKQEEDRQFPAFNTENKDKPLLKLSSNFLAKQEEDRETESKANEVKLRKPKDQDEAKTKLYNRRSVSSIEDKEKPLARQTSAMSKLAMSTENIKTAASSPGYELRHYNFENDENSLQALLNKDRIRHISSKFSFSDVKSRFEAAQSKKENAKKETPKKDPAIKDIKEAPKRDPVVKVPPIKDPVIKESLPPLPKTDPPIISQYKFTQENNQREKQDVKKVQKVEWSVVANATKIERKSYEALLEKIENLEADSISSKRKFREEFDKLYKTIDEQNCKIADLVLEIDSLKSSNRM